MTKTSVLRIAQGCLGFAAFLVVALASVVPAAQKTLLAPKYTPGATLFYHIESRASTTAKVTTPITNPEGGAKASQVIDLLARVDVLGVPPGSPSSTGAVRLRATFEKSQAQSESDAIDPAGPSLEDQYHALQGRSLEFTIEPDGTLVDFRGLEQLFPNQSSSTPALAWLEGLSSGSAFPRDGVSIGRKWRGERPILGAPLSGLAWSTESTYLRDEPCDPRGAAKRAGASPGACAVILTSFEISRRGSSRSDATPDDYRRNGLRTSGSWTGSGESLDSIAILDGVLISSTQTTTQEMDYEIVSASTGSSIRRTGRLQSQSVIALVPPPESPLRP